MASSSFCYGFSTILRGLGALKGSECRMNGEGGEEEEEGEEDQQEEEEGEEMAEAKGS